MSARNRPLNFGQPRSYEAFVLSRSLTFCCIAEWLKDEPDPLSVDAEIAATISVLDQLRRLQGGA